MIARFRILLPFSFSIVSGDQQLQPIVEGQENQKLIFYPPRPAAHDSGLGVLEFAQEPRPNQEKLVNGAPTIDANLFQIDVIRSTFDRRIRDEQGPPLRDPSIYVLFAKLNQWLDRIRAVTQQPYLRPASPHTSPWSVEYLSDDEQELPYEDGLFRRTKNRHFRLASVAMDNDFWNFLRHSCSNFRPAPHDLLMLDAFATLPEVGPALVLASTALETAVEMALNAVCKKQGRPLTEFWEWMNSRGRHWQEPSLMEMYTDILRILTGKSLRDTQQLHHALKQIRDARNSFVHSGVPEIGNRRVNEDHAAKLLQKAMEILKWTKQFLPEEEQVPQFTKHYEFTGSMLL